MVSGPALRYPGSKWRIAEWICGYLPPHETYVEPFFGSGSVFFTKEPSGNEILNDLDGEVVNLFRMIRTQPEALAEAIELTPWARDEYLECVRGLKTSEGDALERARQMLVASWQQFGSKRVEIASSWRIRDGKSQNPLSIWGKLPGRILETAVRLRAAQIDNRPAIDVIARFNDSEVLIYADPPYVERSDSESGLRTRGLYRHEMHEADQHQELLDVLLAHVGPVALSAYPNALYQTLLERHRWTSFQTSVVVQSNARRVEMLWLNPVAFKRLERFQNSLFGGGS